MNGDRRKWDRREWVWQKGSLQMGSVLGCCEWVRCWDVANGKPNLMGCEGESEGKREKPRKREM